MARVTNRATAGPRPIGPEELAVLQTALRVAPASADVAERLEKIAEELIVLGWCGCGCDTVDFARKDKSAVPHPIADGIGTTPKGGTVGVLVFGTTDEITCLEIYDLGAGDDDLRLPEPRSIRPSG